MPGKVNGFSVAYTVAGGVVLWSGIKGSSISDTFRTVLAGDTNPPVTEQIAGASVSTGSTTATAGAGDTGAHGASAAANQAIAKVLAAPYGWSVGSQWSDLVSLWNAESGWNNLAQNPSSGAFGIAQALGHGGSGTTGRYGNQYPSKAANDGDATAQIAWGLSYIRQRWGSPAGAWANEVSEHWY